MYSRITIAVLVIAVLVQVGMEFVLLGGGESMVIPHEMNGFLVVILSLLTGGITFTSAKRQAQLES